jgi:hypothetical protein
MARVIPSLEQQTLRLTWHIVGLHNATRGRTGREGSRRFAVPQYTGADMGRAGTAAEENPAGNEAALLPQCGNEASDPTATAPDHTPESTGGKASLRHGGKTSGAPARCRPRRDCSRQASGNQQQFCR